MANTRKYIPTKIGNFNTCDFQPTEKKIFHNITNNIQKTLAQATEENISAFITELLTKPQPQFLFFKEMMEVVVVNSHSKYIIKDIMKKFNILYKDNLNAIFDKYFSGIRMTLISNSQIFQDRMSAVLNINNTNAITHGDDTSAIIDGHDANAIIHGYDTNEFIKPEPHFVWLDDDESLEFMTNDFISELKKMPDRQIQFFLRLFYYANVWNHSLDTMLNLLSRNEEQLNDIFNLYYCSLRWQVLLQPKFQERIGLGFIKDWEPSKNKDGKTPPPSITVTDVTRPFSKSRQIGFLQNNNSSTASTTSEQSKSNSNSTTLESTTLIPFAFFTSSSKRKREEDKKLAPNQEPIPKKQRSESSVNITNLIK